MTGDHLVVLHSLRPPRAASGYVDLVLEAAPEGATLRFFSWRLALAGRYDVLHVHWPELLVRDSARPWLQVVKRRLLDLLLLRLRLTRTPLVWTAHNLSPHEAGSLAEERSLERLTGQVSVVVRLDTADARAPATPGLADDAETFPIAHGHYRELYGHHPRRASEPGRLLHFGIIRPYKGVPALLEAFADLAGTPGRGAPDVHLSVVGHPHPGQGEVVERAAAADPRVSATLAYVGDDVLVDEICRAQLVVLPYLGGMHNSGALLAALSLDRPVLVPRSPTNTAMADEVGPGWVLQYDGDLDASVLAVALDATAQRPAQRPRLDARSGSAQRARYRAAYARAREITEGRPRRPRARPAASTAPRA